MVEDGDWAVSAVRVRMCERRSKGRAGEGSVRGAEMSLPALARGRSAARPGAGAHASGRRPDGEEGWEEGDARRLQVRRQGRRQTWRWRKKHGDNIEGG